MDSQIQRLRRQIKSAESQLRNLKAELHRVEQEAESGRQSGRNDCRSSSPGNENANSNISAGLGHDEEATSNGNVDSNTYRDYSANGSTAAWPLLKNEYKRYGRQLIMPEIGLHGQLRLKNAKVLIVGVGGLGCPAATYLAGAGVGMIGLMDGDTVELSNLHRQIAHTTNRVGESKVDSAYQHLNSLNSNVYYNRHRSHLTPEKAISIFEQYDLILDCTDHPTSRYLISDACVLTGKSLVSASALRTDGQLVLLNHPSRPPGDPLGGPCYRCIFPKPPPVDSVVSCGEGGILGPVVGVMGVLQALEAIKLLTKKIPSDNSTMSNDSGEAQSPKTSMLMFSAYSNPQFRTVRLRSRRGNCAVCSTEASIVKQSLTSGSIDYITFCGTAAAINILPSHLRISASDFANLPRDIPRKIIDTRDQTQYSICALPDSINVPWTGNSDSWLEKLREAGVPFEDSGPSYIVCRFGNDSQFAAKAMIDRASKQITVKDIKGGLESWRQEVDPDWPEY